MSPLDSGSRLAEDAFATRQAQRAEAKFRLNAPALTPPAPTSATILAVRAGLEKTLAPLLLLLNDVNLTSTTQTEEVNS